MRRCAWYSAISHLDHHVDHLQVVLKLLFGLGDMTWVPEMGIFIG